jgi:hypothetical protein
MPITISHPALSIPLRRFGLVLSALILGSMMPDFEFFLRLTDGRLIAHTIAGIFVFCIPVGLISLFIFHKLIKFPLLSLLPHRHQSRFLPIASEFKFFPVKRLLLIIISLVIGAVSHIFWDSFTHPDGWMVHHIPLLSFPLLTLSAGTIRVYFLLQYLSSLAGALVLVYLYMKWYYSATPVTHIEHHRFNSVNRFRIGFSIASFSLVGGLTYGFFSAYELHSSFMLKTLISHSCIAMVTSFMIALVSFGILWHHLIPHHKRKRIVDPMTSENKSSPGISNFSHPDKKATVA